MEYAAAALCLAMPQYSRAGAGAGYTSRALWRSKAAKAHLELMARAVSAMLPKVQ